MSTPTGSSDSTVVPPTTLPAGYVDLLQDLKARIQAAQVRAALAVNRELVLLYWGIGRDILGRQEAQGWGAKVIDRLATDLRREFPSLQGFSPRNLKYMRAFAQAWPDAAMVQQPVAPIPWGHHCVLLDRVSGQATRLWYVERTREHGWSRSILVHQIETRLHERAGKAVTNFAQALPPQSDLARDLLRDPYTFDFLTLTGDVNERDLERGLLEHVRAFLLELGAGFAFVGSQYHLEVGGEDFYLDLLFYHLKLRCFVVIDLKAGAFKPEYAGKMNFYLAVVDDLLRHEGDGPTIGVILCREKNRVIAEYALRDMGKPLGIAEYRLTESLPDNLRAGLPTIEDWEAQLAASGEAEAGAGEPSERTST